EIKPRATGQIQVERSWKGSGKTVRDFVAWSTGTPAKASKCRITRQWVKKTSFPAVKVSPDDYLLIIESVVCSREYPRFGQFVQ
ncbi:hypothetical protein HAX54_009832, partial [Datura stramonium]|nr:hypothetical protein [Datura stramonium]